MKSNEEVAEYLFAGKYWYMLLLTFCVVGIISNSMLLITIIRTKTLRAPCNILIGACALCDVIHQLGHFPQSWQIFFIGTMDSLSCFIIMFLPTLGVAAGTMTVLCIGIDRFVSIIAASTYRSMNTASYLMKQFSVFAYVVFSVFLMVFYYQDQDAICNMSSVYHGIALGIWTISSVILNFIALIVYAITWRLIRSKESLGQDNLARIFRTILLVTIFDIGGWSLTIIVVAVTNSVPRPEHIRFCYNSFAAIFLNFGIAVKFYVFYFSSTEYRKAINHQLCSREESKVSPTTDNAI